MAGVALAEGRGGLGGDAAVDAGVVGVGVFVGVGGEKLLDGAEEDVIAREGGIEEFGGQGAVASGDQGEAAAVLRFGGAGAGSLGLPLVDVLDTVGVGGQ